MDISFMKELALEAGQIGLRHFGHVLKTYKADRSIVTKADVEIESYLLERIRARYPRHGVLAEESVGQAIQLGRYMWVLDPIDGTQAFSFGFPFWAISIGFMEDGEPTKGVVYQPAIDDLYYCDGDSVYLNGRLLEGIGEQALDQDSYLMVPESMHNNYVFSWPGDCLSLGSVAAHCCYVARGCAVGVLSRAFIWDIAAGVALMEPLGIHSRYIDGSEVDWTALYDGRRLPQPCLGARPSHWPQIASCIRSWNPE